MKSNEKELILISDKYRKYIVSMKLFNENKYFIWGSDLLEKEEDKFLLDPKGNIITSPNLHLFLSSLLESNKDVNLFDINNLLNWKKEVQHILTKFKNGYSGYAKYDLDILLKYFIANDKINIHLLSFKILKEYVGFINFVDDFANQTNDSKLLKLTHERNLRFLWNYVYDNYIWKNKLKNENKLIKNAAFNEKNFRKKFIEIFIRFNNKLKIL